MLTVSFSASGTLAGCKNVRAVLSTDIFSQAGGGDGHFVRLIFEPFYSVLVLEFILHVRKRIASNITVTELVDCSGMD